MCPRDLIARGPKVLGHLAVDGVVGIGPVEPQGADAIVDFELEGLEVHGVYRVRGDFFIAWTRSHLENFRNSGLRFSLRAATPSRDSSVS
ncbi:hypothetical protein D3C87_1581670 [compost metagenome]